MKTSAKSLALLAATLLAFAGSAQAQLETYETVTDWEGSASTFSASGTNATRGEIFTNVSAVKSMTYNFFTTGTAFETTLTATFGEWNTGTNTFVGGTTVSFGTIVIPASNSGNWMPLLTTYGITNNTFTYAKAFDLATITSGLIHATFGYLTDYTKSYALMLTNITGSNTGLALGLTNEDPFEFGFAKGSVDNDWAFAQIIVAPGSQVLVPVPESSTVASIAAGLLVAGLVGYRLRQRRAASSEVSAVVAA